MQPDQPTLTLIVNVILVTGITSLALICHFLKRDKENLTAELTQQREEHKRSASRSVTEPSTAPEAPVRGEQQDIRGYVAKRKQDWITPLSREATR